MKRKITLVSLGTQFCKREGRAHWNEWQVLDRSLLPLFLFLIAIAPALMTMNRSPNLCMDLQAEK